MAKGMSLRGALAKDIKPPGLSDKSGDGSLGAARPSRAPAAKAALAPIPAKYAAMPQDVARAMMDSDKRNVMAGAKKAMAAGTVTGKGDIQRSTRTPGTRGGPGYIGVGGKKG